MPRRYERYAVRVLNESRTIPTWRSRRAVPAHRAPAGVATRRGKVVLDALVRLL